MTRPSRASPTATSPVPPAGITRAFGASPRGTIALERCARAKAWLSGRDYVTPEDVRAVGLDVMRHRVLLTYEAEAEEVTPEDVVTRVLDSIEVP